MECWSTGVLGPKTEKDERPGKRKTPTSNIQVSEDSDIERRMKKQRSNKERRVDMLFWKMNSAAVGLPAGSVQVNEDSDHAKTWKNRFQL